MTQTEDVPPRPRSRALPALALLLTLAACTPPDPAPAASPRPTASADHDRAAQAEVTAGGVTLEVSVPGASPDDPRVHLTTDDRAGTATVTLEPGTAGGADGSAGDDDTDDSTDDSTGDSTADRVPTIDLASGGAFEPRADGSVAVRADGATVGGLSAPRGARLVAVGDARLEVLATSSGTSDGTPGEVTTVLGTSAVKSADWGDREGGRSLAVVPTDWAREAGQAGTDLAWAELVAADPEVDTATMHDQLECHAIGAPDKDSWNLEPWRPDVGLLATMAARCNPTA